MTIQVGETLPAGTLIECVEFDPDNGCPINPQTLNVQDLVKGKKIVIVGCGAQGLHQGLNLRDSGLDVAYALRDEAISSKRQSWKNATDNGFKVGNYQEMIPAADLVINLTPDKQHSKVVAAVMPLMKKGSCLS